MEEEQRYVEDKVRVWVNKLTVLYCYIAFPHTTLMQSKGKKQDPDDPLEFCISSLLEITGVELAENSFPCCSEGPVKVYRTQPVWIS